MRTLLRSVLCVGGAGLGLMASGCSGPSVWQQSWVPQTDVVAASTAADAPVRVRSIPWSRMDATIKDIQGQFAASDVHPEDWSAEQKLSAKSALLRGLQVSGDPASIDVVGRCEFRSTDSILPDGEDRPSLERFARSVGATDVVWSSRSLGKADKIVDRPVTSYSTGNFWNGFRRDASGRDRWWNDSYTESSTTWVPVRVSAEETGFVVFFLRGR